MKRISKDEIDRFHDYNIYVPSRTIFMGSEDPMNEQQEESGVDAAMVERIVKNLTILDNLHAAGEKPDSITIIMNNIGGDVTHGMAIYDAIKACASHVTIKVFGHAMSMGSIILQAADERIMAPNSRFMIHYGQFAIDKEARTAYKWADESKKYDKWMENMYLAKIHEKQPAFKVRALQNMLAHDTILTPQETIALGLCDSVLGEE